MPKLLPKYDYIIAGAGLAGLSLVYKLKLDPVFENLTILLIDKSPKNQNDRTWCFWSKNKDVFDSLVYHSWSTIHFYSDHQHQLSEISPYSYKMIRGIDFYQHTLEHIKTYPTVDVLTESITEITENKSDVTVTTETGQYKADYAFKSYPDKLELIKDHFVWQHFKGWIIETDTDAFDEEKAIFMDFRVDQADETRFFYVLPTSKRRALVELAIFSGEIPEPAFYDSFLKAYIKDKLRIEKYTVTEEELGAIPMTTHQFQDKKATRILNIGTNGGSVKPSSGYAFSRIQNHINHLISEIKAGRLSQFHLPKTRYQLYDKIMLNAIISGKTTGKKVFEKLFARTKPQAIFKFLDEEKNLVNDLKILSGPPKLPFIKAYFEEIFKR